METIEVASSDDSAHAFRESESHRYPRVLPRAGVKTSASESAHVAELIALHIANRRTPIETGRLSELRTLWTRMVGRQGDGEASKAEKDTPVAAPPGPSHCASRDRAADAADAIQDMAVLMNQMDPEVVKRLVHARNAAAGVYLAFPEGDQRFASVESDSDDEDDANREVEAGEGEAGCDDVDGDNEELCQGLLDDRMDTGPRACLIRAKEEHDFDIVNEMDTAELEFFERIRLVNHLRKIVAGGAEPVEAVRRVRSVLDTKDSAVLQNDALLEPVIDGDLVLTALESGEEPTDASDEPAQEVIDALQKSLRASKIL